MIKDPVKKNYIESILLSGKNLLALINDILDLSKIEADKLELHYTDVNIRSFFNEFQKIFYLRLVEKELELITDFSSGFPNTIRIDEIRLRQILFNLIGNAVKFTHSGNIKLSAFYNNLTIDENSDDGSIELNIIIKDTGIGMKKEFIDNVFEPFAQASGNYGGTGLGLSITRKLVNIMGGSITAYSEIDKGSSFHIVIPNVKFNKEALEDIQQVDYKSGALAQNFADNTIQPEADKPDNDFNGADIVDFDELLSTFENELIITWSAFKERQPIKEIKIFAERLIQVGKKHNSKTLIQYGETLKTATLSFNVKKIIKEIYKFPSLIDEHKNFKK